ncbi:hypothetical protein, partial [Streptococcus suis]
AVRSIVSRLTNAFDAQLVTDLDVGSLTSSFTNGIDSFIDDDVRQSIEESNRPIVNIQVQNEGDLEFIRTHIKDMDSKEFYT